MKTSARICILTWVVPFLSSVGTPSTHLQVLAQDALEPTTDIRLQSAEAEAEAEANGTLLHDSSTKRAKQDFARTNLFHRKRRQRWQDWDAAHQHASISTYQQDTHLLSGRLPQSSRAASRLVSTVEYLTERGQESKRNRGGNDFDILLALIDMVPWLRRMLDRDGQDDDDIITLFAPRDHAFYKLVDDLSITDDLDFNGSLTDYGDERLVLDYLVKFLGELADERDESLEDVVGAILLHHMGSGSYNEARLRREGSIDTYYDGTLKVIKARRVRSGQRRTKLYSDYENDLADRKRIGGRAIIHYRWKDIPTANGLIHVLKDVLLPLELLEDASLQKTSDQERNRPTSRPSNAPYYSAADSASPTITQIQPFCVPTMGACVSSEDELQKATSALRDNDIVSLCIGTQIQVNSSIVISRNNIGLCCPQPRRCRVSGYGHDRLLVVTGQDFTLSGLWLSGGVGGRDLYKETGCRDNCGFGGGNVLIVAPGTHRILDCYFTGGSSTGPLNPYARNIGANLHVMARCGGRVILQNSVSDGAFGGGGVAIEDASDVMVEDSTIRNSEGSGLYIGIWAAYPQLRDPGPDIRIRRSVFAYNGNEGDTGGGIFASAIGLLPSLLIENSMFEGNVAYGGGAASVWPDLGEFARLSLANNEGRNNVGTECDGFHLGTSQLGIPDDGTSAVCIDDLAQTINVVHPKATVALPAATEKVECTGLTENPQSPQQSKPSPGPTPSIVTQPPHSPFPTQTMRPRPYRPPRPTYTPSQIPTPTVQYQPCLPTTGPCISSEEQFQSVATSLDPNDIIAICGTAEMSSWTFDVDSSTLVTQNNITLCCAGPKLCRIRAVDRHQRGLAFDRILVVTGADFTMRDISLMFGIGGRSLVGLTSYVDASAGGGNLAVANKGKTVIEGCFFGGGMGKPPTEDDPPNTWGGTGGDVYIRSNNVILRNSIFERGLAQLGGGAAIMSPTILIEDCSFRGNRNVGLFSSVGQYDRQPGQNLVVRRSNFVWNGGDFGGILASSIGVLPTLIIEDCVFDENSANHDGAAAAIFPDQGIFGNLTLKGNIGKGNYVDRTMSTVPVPCDGFLSWNGTSNICLDIDAIVNGNIPADSLNERGTSCPDKCIKCLEAVSKEWFSFCLQADGGCGIDGNVPYIYNGDGYKLRDGRCDISYFSGGYCTQMPLAEDEQTACVRQWEPTVERYMYLISSGQGGSCKEAIYGR